MAEAIEAIIDSRLDLKWQVSAERLVDKLRNSCPGKRLAICDAVRRWWELSEGADPTRSLREVGLLRD